MQDIYKDSLTNLPSRFALMEYLQGLEHANIFLIDIDNFSNINNAYGFKIGDLLLIEIAKLLAIAKPYGSKLFRLNSDEFVLVSTNIMSLKILSDDASSMVSFFDQTDILVLDDIDMRVSISIGVATGKSSETLKNARTAIKELREHRRASYKIYNPDSSFI